MQEPIWKVYGKFMVRMVVGFLIAMAFIGGCSYLNEKAGIPDDNVFEQMIEDHIEFRTGIEIDLTPED